MIVRFFPAVQSKSPVQIATRLVPFQSLSAIDNAQNRNVFHHEQADRERYAPILVPAKYLQALWPSFLAALTYLALQTASCHCKAATFTFTIPSDTRKANRCNCTWCQKPAFTSLSVEPEGFKLLTPASQEELGDYYPRGPQGNNFGHRYFCKTCATHLWREGQYEYPEGKLNKVSTLSLLQDFHRQGMTLTIRPVFHRQPQYHRSAAGRY